MCVRVCLCVCVRACVMHACVCMRGSAHARACVPCLYVCLCARSQVKHVFLVGDASANASVSKRLAREAERHGDVLQAGLPEWDPRGTHMGLLGLLWAGRHCRHARHVLKTGHDAWVNLPALLTYLRSHPLAPPVGLGGACTTDADSPAGPDHTFCSGPGYVTTPDVAAEIVRVSRDVPFSPREDEFVDSCLQNLRMSVQRLPGFSVRAGDSAWITELCQLHGKRVMYRHGFTPEEIRFIWAEGNCKTKRPLPALKIGLPLSRRQVELDRGLRLTKRKRRVSFG